MSGKRNMSIGTKITLGFVGLAFVSVIVGAIGLYSLSVIGEFDDQICRGGFFRRSSYSWSASRLSASLRATGLTF